VYCELKFLQELFDYLGNNLAFDENYGSSYNVREMLGKQCDIWMDVPFDKITELGINNPFFKSLWKKSLEGGSKLHDYSSEFSKLPELIHQTSLPPHSLYFHNQDEKLSNELLFTYNLLNSNIEFLKLTSKDFLISNDFTISPDKELNNFSDWSFLRNNNLPITDIIIADNYLVKDLEAMKHNILGILNNLIKPNLCSMELNVMITVEKDILSAAALSDRLNIINDEISKKKLSHKYNIGIYEVKKDLLHDRDIITNYLWLRSGHSFDYFNKKNTIKSNKNTSLDIRGVGLWGKKEHGILKHLRAIRNACIMNNDFIGGESNRILVNNYL